MAIHIGHRRAGWAGLVVAGACFIFPAVVIVLALAWAYVRFGTTPDIDSILGGFNAAVVGIISAITIKMLRTSIGRLWQMVVAAGALLISTVGNSSPGEVAVLSIITGMAVDLGTKRARLGFRRRREALSLPEESTLPTKQSQKRLVPSERGMRLSPVTLLAIGVIASAGTSLRLAHLAQTGMVFFRTGLGSYGGGFAIIPHLKGVVDRNHWLTGRQFADAVAIGKLTPGPVLLLATFIGYLQEGFIGALVATLAIFAAPFCLIVMAGTWLDRLRSRRPVRAALRGLTPAVLGLMAAAAVTLGTTLSGDAEIGIAVAVTLTLLRFELNPAAVLGAGGIARLALRALGV
jgi:chromate transporter